MKDDRYLSTLLHVVGYQEDGKWCALCLEMDLVGVSEEFSSALEDLQELIQKQFELAREKGDPGLVFFPAEPKYYRMFAEAISEEIIGKRTNTRVRTTRIAVPSIAA